MRVVYEVIRFDELSSWRPEFGRIPVETLEEAAANIESANDYVVAIEDGKYRELTSAEEGLVKSKKHLSQKHGPNIV